MKACPTIRGSARRGFTLIELLTVIAIMGILAAMVVGLAAAAGKKKKIARVQTELARLEHAIEWYHEKKGNYPPDNPNDPAINSLFYELTGTISGANGNYFTNILAGVISGGIGGSVTNFFGVDGFVNSSMDKNEVQNFLPQLSSASHKPIYNSATIFAEVLVVPVEGPTYTSLSAFLPAIQNPDVSSGRLNPWRYMSSSPTNNPNSYDLWADIIIGGKTNRICNWRKDPFDPN